MWKQETRTNSNLEESKWCLWMYNYLILLLHKQRVKFVSAVVSELAKKDMEKFQSGGVKAMFINASIPSYWK